MARQNVQRWLEWLIDGCVIAVPPREAWSRARSGKLDGSAPPLCVLQHMWALPGLTSRQYRQVCVGNALLRAAFKVMADALHVGRMGIVEHPDWTDDEQATAFDMSCCAQVVHCSGCQLHTMCSV